MQAGLVWSCDRYEISLGYACGVSTSVTGSATGFLARFTAYADTRVDRGHTFLDTGIYQSVFAESLPSGASTTASLVIPVLSVSEDYTVSSAFETAVDCRVEIDDLKIYNLDDIVWEITASELRWYVNGSLQYTYGAIDELALVIFAPASIPLIGVPATLGAIPQSGGGTTPDAPAEWHVVAEVNGTATGGWRFFADGEWHDLPIEVEVLPAPGCTCSAEDLTDIVGGTRTNNAYANGYSLYDVKQERTDYYEQICSILTDPITGVETIGIDYRYKMYAESRQHTKAGFVTTIPNLNRGVARMNDDYAALIYRSGLPLVTAKSDTHCRPSVITEGPFIPAEDVCTSEEDRNARYSAFLGTVTNDPHVIEDPFGETVYAPYRVVRAYSFESGTSCYNGGSCAYDPSYCDGFVEEGDSFSHGGLSMFPGTLDSAFDNPQMAPYLASSDPIGSYYNYWACPHWSFCYWFPPDDADDAEQWQVDGDIIAASGYWLPIGEQWLSNPYLPEGDNRQTRNHIPLSPLYESGLRAYVKLVLAGSETHYWGLCRFKVDDTELPATKALAAASDEAWTFEDCTATFGSTIVLDPDAEDIIAELDLGRFTEAPYLYPHVCDLITLGWVGTNIVSCDVYVVSHYGLKVKITSTPGEFRKPVGRDSKYAGSWGQDFGHGVVDDTGEDTDLTAGKSADSMADAERVMAFLLLMGRTAAKLRYEITVTDPDVAATINYPSFRLPTEAPTLYHETRQAAIVAYPLGPGIRIGQQRWYDSFSNTILTMPEPEPLGYKMTVLDWLCLRRELFQGIDRTSGLATEATTLYDTVEITAKEDLSQFTTTCPLPPRASLTPMALINSLAEVPPMAGFPTRARDDDWKPTGAYGQVAYSLAQETRVLVNAKDTAHLRETEVGDPYTTNITAPLGWKATGHRRPTDNNEGATHFVTVREEVFATVSPWHGYSCILNKANVLGWPSYDVGPAQRHARSSTSSSGLVIGTMGNGRPFPWDDKAPGRDPVRAAVQWFEASKNGELLVALLLDDGDLVLTKTTDNGASLVDLMTIDSDIAAFDFKSCKDGRTFFYLVTTGDNLVRCKLYDKSLTLVQSFDTDIVDADPSFGLSVDESTGQAGEWRMGIQYNNTSGDSIFMVSDKRGEHFT